MSATNRKPPVSPADVLAIVAWLAFHGKADVAEVPAQAARRACGSLQSSQSLSPGINMSGWLDARELRLRALSHASSHAVESSRCRPGAPRTRAAPCSGRRSGVEPRASRPRCTAYRPSSPKREAAVRREARSRQGKPRLRPRRDSPLVQTPRRRPYVAGDRAAQPLTIGEPPTRCGAARAAAGRRDRCGCRR